MSRSPHRRLCRVLHLAVVCAWGSVAASAAFAAARLGPINVARDAGAVLEIPIGFSASEAVTCVQFDLLFSPARVTLGAVAMAAVSSDHVVESADIASGRRRVVIYSSTLAALEGGYVLRIPVTFVSTGDSSLDVTAVTLASTEPAAVAFTGSALTPAISSSAGNTGPTSGAAANLNVEPTYGSGVTYQWQINGADIAGATGSSLSFASTQPFHAGTYTVVTRVNGMVLTSQSFAFNVNAAPPSNARVMNLSTRALDLTGDNLLIPGFVISGTGTKRILVRAVGPGLFDTFGLQGYLADPQLSLRNQDTGAQIAANDDWGTSADKAAIISTSQSVGAFPLLGSSKDSVLLVELPAGHYTAPAIGSAGGTGIAMVELYDADPDNTGGARLVNISNRGFVDVGDKIMIPGFVVSNEGSRTFLIRAVGPGLRSTFGLQGILEDPVLTVFNSGGQAILSNDNWDGVAGSTTTSTVAGQVGAFPLVAGSTDAAFVVTLPPGGYTIQATGKAATTGVALVEVYLVP